MKKWVVFILGILTGIVLTAVALLLIGNAISREEDNRISYADQPSVFKESDCFEIFQVLNSGALARCRDYSYDTEIYSDPIVYIPADGQNTFYDDQVIRVPKGGAAIQLGTFRYSSKLGERVVPIVVIQSNGSENHNDISAENPEQDEKSTDGEITFANKPKTFSASNKFKVDEVLENGVIAKCKDMSFTGSDFFDDPYIYIPSEGDNMYYNDQIFSIPAGKKAYQVGTIKLKHRSYRNVLPVIEFK